ncbi:MAG TPA: tRNA glutamyl-Q(34) synthetase GluQRS [Candidatus Accumulibacter phosphatis]|nr:MAG: Glutamyl-Q tRNA(Asp) synthetase [Candidatus Accumulibacter sp. SK-11]HAY28121.1 tRNA glutamyl-Q(34) synthetase GluQRS [Accumulibacter sp.]HRL74331.1 tRNA glutamyl-Q(34) synthetase GluQRS [Candidatus Accumulibacter phosphatis]HCN67491.1 tRNA glutamyl-Q(34) synthetase GluQRS [Accumulibacter sp.]HCV14435.1 tRNA glutamyl-Q(34) synthetase GluQRS [Accumulibacter sp.]
MRSDFASAAERPASHRGRFAPSPTGRLHFGSLVAAVGSYLDARARGGSWLLRIEDIDQQRSVPGAADAILRTLAGLAFEWDGEVVYQSRRLDAYRAALSQLQGSGDVYPCACSRREIAACSPPAAVDGGLVYPGTCRPGLPPGRSARAWRMRVPAQELRFADRVQGTQRQDLAEAVGDFVLLRADGQYAYQLAVVVDDAEQQISSVVRGADLLDSTPRQIWLAQRLQLPIPAYAHLPLVSNAAGEKLSKQTRAKAVDAAGGSPLLAAALAFLGHVVPPDVRQSPLPEFWRWAIANWSIAHVPARRSAVADHRLP